MTSLPVTALLCILQVHICKVFVNARLICQVDTRIIGMTDNLYLKHRWCFIRFDVLASEHIPYIATLDFRTNCSYYSSSYRWIYYYDFNYLKTRNYGQNNLGTEPTTKSLDIIQHIFSSTPWGKDPFGYITYDVVTTIEFTKNAFRDFTTTAYVFFMPSLSNYYDDDHLDHSFRSLDVFDQDFHYQYWTPEKFYYTEEFYPTCPVTKPWEQYFYTFHAWADIGSTLEGSCVIEETTLRTFNATCVGFNDTIPDSFINYNVIYGCNSTVFESTVYSGPEPEFTFYIEEAINKRELYYVDLHIVVYTSFLSRRMGPYRRQVLPDPDLTGTCEIEPKSGYRNETTFQMNCTGFDRMSHLVNYTVHYNSSITESVLIYEGSLPIIPFRVLFNLQGVHSAYTGYVHVLVREGLYGLSYYHEPLEILILPELKGGCSIHPLSGYQTITPFIVGCDLYNITTDTILNYTIHSNSSDTGRNEVFIGRGPVPPIRFDLEGDISNNYAVYIFISVQRSTGAMLKLTPLKIQVKPDPAKSIKNTTNILGSIETLISATGESLVFDDMLTNGDTSGAADLVLSITGGLNLDINETTTTVNQSEQRIQVRESVSEYLVQFPVSKLSDLELVTECWNSLTSVQEEVSQKIVDNAVDGFSNLADVLSSQVTETSVENAERLSGMVLNGSVNFLTDYPHTGNKSANDTQQMKTTVSKIVKVVEKVADAVMDIVTPHDPPKVYHTSKLDVVVFKKAPSDVGGRSMSQRRTSYGKEVTGSFLLPNGTAFIESLREGAGGFGVGVQCLFYGHNPFEWDVSAESVSTPVMDLKIKDKYHQELNVTQQENPFHLSFSIADIVIESNEFASSITVVYTDSNILNYTTTQSSVIALSMVLNDNDGIILRVTTNDTNITDISFKIYSSRDDYPIIDLVKEHGVSLDIGNNFTTTIVKNGRQNSSQNTHDTWNASIGILPMLSSESDGYFRPRLEPCSEGICTSEVNITVSVETYKVTCLYWDKTIDRWSSHGCEASSLTTLSTIHCDCNHLTAFSGSLLVQPNFVNPFTDAALFLTFFSNPIVVTTVVVIWLIYSLFVCWARKMDRHDSEKSGLILLGDNNPADTYTYLVCVVTSWWRNAGTTASVSMYVQGEEGQSAKHCLKSGVTDSDHILSSGAEDWFVMNTPKCLGELQSIYLWHDNKGTSPSWSLSRIIVKDIQRNETWTFPYDSWVAIDMGSMSTDVLLTAKTEEEIAAKGHKEFLFKSSEDLRDGHIWISIVSKPMKSTFTRVQRLSCALSLLLTTMLTSIMFHGIPTDNPEDQAKLGEIRFSLTDIIIGIESSLIMFPINVLIIQIFTRIGAKPVLSTKHCVYVPTTAPLKSESEITKQDEEHLAKGEKGGKQLPWWTVYIGWFLVILTSVVSSYFVMLYGLKYGPRKSVDWLISFFTAFFQSAFVTQPLKVIGVAVVVTMILKKPLRVDTNRKGITEVKQEQTTEHVTNSISNRLTYTLMKQVKKQAWLDEEMRSTMKDLGLYLVYVAMVLVIVHGHRSVTELHNVTHVLEEMFITPNEESIAFNEVAVAEDIWAYHDRISPILSNIANQSDISLDGTWDFYLVGPYRIRQLRVERDSCLLQEFIRKSFSFVDCHAVYWMGNEDTESYNLSWSRPLPVSITATEWDYKSAWELETTPFVGKQETYGGGGYVVILEPNSASEKIAEIQSNHWLDERTRAILIEFTVYNPNRNIFSVVILAFEFSNIGAIFPYYQIFTAKLYNYGSELKIFVAVCEVLFILFNIVFTYIEIQEFRKIGRKRYFRNFWSCIELLQLTLSYLAIAFFFQRTLSVSSVIDKMKNSDGSDFLSFYPAVTLDFILMYITAFLTGLVILKIIKFFKFNKRLYTIASAISDAKGKLLGHMLFSGIVMTGFTHFAFLVFGKALYDYRTFGQCVITLYNFLLGVSDFESLRAIDRVLGPIFYVGFISTFCFCLITVFISILHHAIKDVRAQCNKINADLEVVDYMYKRIKNLF